MTSDVWLFSMKLLMRMITGATEFWISCKYDFKPKVIPRNSVLQNKVLFRIKV